MGHFGACCPMGLTQRKVKKRVTKKKKLEKKWSSGRWRWALQKITTFKPLIEVFA